MTLDQLLVCIDKMQKHGGTFRYLVQGLPGLLGPDIKLGHKIIVGFVPETRELIAYVEILGLLKSAAFLLRGAVMHWSTSTLTTSWKRRSAAPSSRLIQRFSMLKIGGRSGSVRLTARPFGIISGRRSLNYRHSIMCDLCQRPRPSRGYNLALFMVSYMQSRCHF